MHSRFVGRPGDYVYIFHSFRMEEVIVFHPACALTPWEHPLPLLHRCNMCPDFPFLFLLQCAPGGCLMELCIQLSIIMLGKQLIQNNLFEIGIP